MLTVQEIRDRLAFVRTVPNIAAVYLFGSAAREKTHALSDIDIAVLFRPGMEEQNRFRELLRVSADIRATLGREDVDVVDLSDATPLLRHRILRDGVLLHCTDEGARVRNYVDTLNQYVDTAPLRRLQEEAARRYFGGKQSTVG